MTQLLRTYDAAHPKAHRASASGPPREDPGWEGE